MMIPCISMTMFHIPAYTIDVTVRVVSLDCDFLDIFMEITFINLICDIVNN